MPNYGEQIFLFVYNNGNIQGAYDKFPDFFVQALKILVDS